MRARDNQHGGDHYRNMSVQPWDVIDTWPHAERVAFYRGNAIKYLMRLNDKDTPSDNAGKAKHYCEKLIEVLSEVPQVPDEPELPLDDPKPGDRFTVDLHGRTYQGVLGETLHVRPTWGISPVTGVDMDDPVICPETEMNCVHGCPTATLCRRRGEG